MEIMIAAISHPEWAIDEYARIFRFDDWLNPPVAPKITDVIILMNRMFMLISGNR